MGAVDAHGKRVVVGEERPHVAGAETVEQAVEHHRVLELGDWDVRERSGPWRARWYAALDDVGERMPRDRDLAPDAVGCRGEQHRGVDDELDVDRFDVADRTGLAQRR